MNIYYVSLFKRLLLQSLGYPATTYIIIVRSSEHFLRHRMSIRYLAYPYPHIDGVQKKLCLGHVQSLFNAPNKTTQIVRYHRLLKILSNSLLDWAAIMVTLRKPSNNQLCQTSKLEKAKVLRYIMHYDMTKRIKCHIDISIPFKTMSYCFEI